MIQLDKDYYVYKNDIGYPILGHLQCKHKAEHGYVRLIRTILIGSTPERNYCNDCRVHIPLELVEKIKFIYAKVK